MTVQVPGDKFPHSGATRSWSVTYGSHGIDYITQNPVSNEIFIGGGFVRGRHSGIYDVGNSDDGNSDRLTRVHLHGILPVVFGTENWGQDSKSEPRVKSEWTGIMGFTADNLPLVGQLPQSVTRRAGNGEWIAAGFNGYGMVNCWLSGKALAHKILGKDVDWFPEQYEITQERLEAMKDEDVVRDFFGRS
jgi:glycine/D-amino acid oxidase-like deaminating enzyme